MRRETQVVFGLLILIPLVTLLGPREQTLGATARIVLKAYGGMTLEVGAVALVEGWYAD